MERFLIHGEGDRFGQRFRLLPWHREFLWRWYELDQAPGALSPWWYNEALVGAERGAVKALALDTPIPTPTGWSTMGDLQVGDLVFGTAGAPVRVTNTSAVFVGNRCFRVRFNDGTSIVADAGHRWAVELQGRPKVVTTAELAEMPGVRCGHVRLPEVAPVEPGGSLLPIDPYALGCWLGDGTAADGRFTSADPEIPARIAERGEPMHHYGGFQYAFSDGRGRGRRSWPTFVERLRSLGVLRAKHIPAAYLRASAADRLELLRGLLDTDGSVDTRGRVTFSNTSKALIDDTMELIRSLGIRCTVVERRSLLNGVDHGPHWLVSLTTARPVVTLPRKADRLGAAGWRRTVQAVEPVPSVATKCITVDAPDSLFLAGEGWAPTHNSEFFAGLALLEMGGPDAFRRLTPIIHVAAGSYKQAGELFGQVQIMAGGTAAAPVHAAPLHGMFDVFEQEVLYRDGRPGRIERLAAEAGTNEGGKTTTFLADELHEWTGRRERLYTVLSAALTKRTPPGRVCGMSTAAKGRGQVPPADTDPLLWRLYARGLVERGDPTSRYLFDWREAADHWNLDDPDEVRAALLEAGRAADITWQVETRAREILSKKIPRHEAARYYLNRFVDLGADSWLLELPGAWEECADPDAVPADGADVIVGVDMALHQDSVGVIVAGRLPDGRVGWYPRCWKPSPVTGAIDHLDVFSTIAGTIAQRWRVKGIVYDPRFFQLPANMLEEQGFRVIEFPQSPDRLIPADGLLYDLLRTRQLAHPDDPVLSEHARNAGWREGERGRYLSKAKAAGHMDLVRAGAMATAELLASSSAGPAPASATPTVGAPSADLYRPTGRLDL